MPITADDLLNDVAGGAAGGGGITADDLLADLKAPTAPIEEPRSLLTPVKEAGAALASAGSALAGGKVTLPFYGDVPEAGPDETLAQSAMRAPARLGAATVRALPSLDLPGNLVEEAASEAGHPYLGKAAGLATNLLVPGALAKGAGVGRKLATELSKTANVGSLAERAGITVQKAIQRTRESLYGVAKAHYDEAATLADQAGTRVGMSHMSGATKEAEKMLEEFGERLPKGARDIVEEIATHPGNVSYAQWDSIRGRIQDMALRPEQFATSEKFVPKAMTQLDRLVKDGLRKSVEGTPAGKALDAADSGWKEASDFNRLIGKRTRTGKTGTEVESALSDPARYRAAVEAMTPIEKEAYKTLARAANISDPLRKVSIGKIALTGAGRLGSTALGFEGGHLYASQTGSKNPLLVASGTALAALALGNPRVALLVSKGLKTPAATAAATKITTELASLLEEE